MYTIGILGSWSKQDRMGTTLGLRRAFTPLPCNACLSPPTFHQMHWLLAPLVHRALDCVSRSCMPPANDFDAKAEFEEPVHVVVVRLHNYMGEESGSSEKKWEICVK